MKTMTMLTMPLVASHCRCSCRSLMLMLLRPLCMPSSHVASNSFVTIVHRLCVHIARHAADSFPTVVAVCHIQHACLRAHACASARMRTAVFYSGSTVSAVGTTRQLDEADEGLVESTCGQQEDEKDQSDKIVAAEEITAAEEEEELQALEDARSLIEPLIEALTGMC